MDIRITFGIIVLNGEPFTRYCIRSIYEHAYEIIICEGASYGAKEISSEDGHSTDGTLDLLYKIKDQEDPDDKLIIVRAEDEGHPNGFWPGEKLEQCQSFTRRATGNYIWQIDIDEFYKRDDILKVNQILKSNQDITAMSFKQIPFFGGFDYVVDGWYLKRHGSTIHRVFKWEDGYKYINHRPPTVVNKDDVNLRKINFFSAEETRELGIYLYHYSYVFPKQYKEKINYYKNSEWLNTDKKEYLNDIESFKRIKNPFKIYLNRSLPSWIKKFSSNHPIEVEKLRKEVLHLYNIDVRKTDDLEKITSSILYNFIIKILSILNPIHFKLNKIRNIVMRNFLK